MGRCFGGASQVTRPASGGCPHELVLHAGLALAGGRDRVPALVYIGERHLSLVRLARRAASRHRPAGGRRSNIFRDRVCPLPLKQLFQASEPPAAGWRTPSSGGIASCTIMLA